MKPVMAAAALGVTGCMLVPEPEVRDRNTPPNLDAVEVRAWPPLGPDDEVTVQVSDMEGLQSVEATFLHSATRPVSGTSATVAFTGRELGEGFGMLTVVVTDARGWTEGAHVENVLVDLTPPVVDNDEPVILRADGQGPRGELTLSVGDAWALAHLELRFTGAGAAWTHDFSKGRPRTVGWRWDRSVVSVPATALGPGSGTAEVRVTDAAGNTATASFPLTVDGTAPTAAFVEPAEGSPLAGKLPVVVEASDAEGPVWVELFAAGVRVATTAGPRSETTLDGADFAPGEITIEAVATDAAGNRSAPATRTLWVQ